MHVRSLLFVGKMHTDSAGTAAAAMIFEPDLGAIRWYWKPYTLWHEIDVH